MTRRRLRDPMILRGAREEGALVDEPAEPAPQLVVPALEVVGPQLIDGEHHDERGPLRGGLPRERRGGECRHRGGEEDEATERTATRKHRPVEKGGFATRRRDGRLVP